MKTDKELWDAGYEYAQGHMTIALGVCGDCGGTVMRGTSQNSMAWQEGRCVECGKRPDPILPVLKMNKVDT